MSKKILAVLLSLSIIGLAVGMPVFADEDINEKIESSDVTLMASSYNIYTASDLDGLRSDLAGTYYLMNDIDLSDYTDWKMFGNFSGTFDGQGHAIRGIHTTSPSLFEYCTGTIQNLNIDITINYSGDAPSVGGIATQLGYSGKGTSAGTFFNCHINANIDASSTASSLYVGGLAGYYNFGSVTACSVIGNINVNGKQSYVGGLLGYEYDGTNVGDSYSRATITDKSEMAVLGGIIGKEQQATFYNSYASCSITSTATSKTIGAVVGEKSNHSHHHNIYYNISLCSQNDSNIGEGKTISALKDKANLKTYDFDIMWTISDNTNGGYPHINYREPTFSGGYGTEYSPYIITTANEFNNIRYNLQACYKLNNDIELTNEMLPLSLGASGFFGQLDGDGHTVSNVILANSSYQSAGLFSTAYNSASISNLEIKYGDFNIEVEKYFGGIVGGNSDISNASVTINNCKVSGNINIYTNKSSRSYIGGIVGYIYNQGSINNCSALGSFDITSNSEIAYVGGIVGYTSVILNNCNSYMNINVNNAYENDNNINYVGGISGQAFRAIVQCYNAGELKIENANGVAVGGILGAKSGGSMEQCISNANITVFSRFSCIGGLIGSESARVTGYISNCYAGGNIKASSLESIRVGGLIGLSYTPILSGSMDNSYAMCKFDIDSSESKYVGGLIGENRVGENNTCVSVNYCYYDSTISKCTDTENGTPKTTALMKSQSTYANWDFTDIWGISSDINEGYPYLRALESFYSVAVKGVQLNKTSTSLSVGETETLTANVSPSNATNKNVIWTSSNTSVATVSTSGVVTAKAVGTATITATTEDGRYTATCTVTVTAPTPETVATPTISTSNIVGGKSVSISCATSGAIIYYTTNGSNPTTSSTQYNGAINLTSAGTTTVKAIAVRSGYTNSSVANQSVSISKAATPTASQASGIITSPINVTLSSTSGTAIYYTTDGSTPTTNSNRYSSAININSTTTLKIIAAVSGYANSDVATYNYTYSAPSKTFTMLRDNYSFANTWSSFGYSYSYRIPLERYISVFGVTEGTQRYNSDDTWGGSCYGFSSTSSLFFENKLNYKQYSPSATSLFNISAPKTPKANLTILMERYQIAQSLYSVSSERSNNWNRMDKIIQAVKHFEETGYDPIVLCMWSYFAGHAVVPYKCVTNADGSYSIYVYDNNYPSSTSRIVNINKNMNGFSYDSYSRAISFNYAETVYDALQGGVSLFSVEDEQEDVATLIVNSDNINITDVNGVSIENIDGAYEVIPVERDFNQMQKTYVIPNGDYIVQNNSTDIDNLQISISNSKDYQIITTDDLKATANVGVYASTGRVYAYTNSTKTSNQSIKTLSDTGVSKLFEAVGKSLGASAANSSSMEIVADSSVSVNGIAVSVGTTGEVGSASISTMVDVNGSGSGKDFETVVSKNSLTYSNGAVNGKLSYLIYNNTQSLSEARVIVGLYSDDGQLVSIIKNDDEVLALGSNYIDLGTLNYFGLNKSGYKVKCFVWDSLDNMQPLAEATSTEI